ncbi:MAG: hypothetical protein EXR62_14525 [Chloroflexi bacterium]|nr:hypothetical protein [Chloroflexota bacterium]
MFRSNITSTAAETSRTVSLVRLSEFVNAHTLTGLALLLGFALRLYALAGVPLRWDEGWSLGISPLPLAELLRITALDVHPPFYYLLLKGWLSFGHSEFMVRFLSVIAGTLTIPLLYAAGKRWVAPLVEGSWAGALAACYAALAPPLIYYSQVTRMFALAGTALALAIYGLEAWLDTGRRRFALLFVAGAVLAAYTFYYSILVIGALLLYTWLRRPGRWPAITAWFSLVGLLYLPWVLYVWRTLAARVAEHTAFHFSLADSLGLLPAGFYGLVFAYGVGWRAVYAVFLALGAGLLLSHRHLSRRLLLPWLVIFATLFGVGLGAQAHMFAARYVLVASPFLALGIGWALAAAARRSPWIAAALLGLILFTIWPSLQGYVYAKEYEVSGAFDPSADWQVLHQLARPTSLVYFNVLSLAGTYSRYRQPDDPPWSYALRWDPVIEPLATAQARIKREQQPGEAQWFVLYKGTYAANADLKRWLDEVSYPATGLWKEDTLYQAYLPDDAPPSQPVPPGATFSPGIQLAAARFSTHPAGHGLTVELQWRIIQPIAANDKIFVHLYEASTGRLVAQHDATPANDTRPLSTWQPGELVTDRHGLLLERATPVPAGPLRLVVGWYDPVTGQRLTLLTGAETLELGEVIW